MLFWEGKLYLLLVLDVESGMNNRNEMACDKIALWLKNKTFYGRDCKQKQTNCIFILLYSVKIDNTLKKKTPKEIGKIPTDIKLEVSLKCTL